MASSALKSTTGGNSNQWSITQHPLESIKQTIASTTTAESRGNRVSHMQSANEGPADIISKVSGAMEGGKREDDGPYFTNNEGIPWPDVDHSKTIGGVPVASDVFLFQKQQTSNRSKNLERMVHPCGSGAFGYFECTHDVTHLTKANFLQSVGERTPIFIRFSTVTLGREYPDEGRNPRGFAVKFYTKEGNYDNVGLNFPVFFCRDPIQGPDVIRSQHRNPQNFLLDMNSIFDLLASTMGPRSAGATTMVMAVTLSSGSKAKGDVYTSSTFFVLRIAAHADFIADHADFIAKHGQKQFTYDEAIRTMGEDPDYSKRDLWEAIERGEEPEWTTKVQIMEPEDADPEKLGFDPFDVTKVWPCDQFHMHDFGRLVLNKNPGKSIFTSAIESALALTNAENFHRDVELAAFSPGSMVPGIGDSPDPLLHFRMFFYRDAQYHRIGVNLHQVPVNCPFMSRSYSSLNFDGPMRADANHAGNPQYVPNSYAYKFRPDTVEPAFKVSDNVCSRKSHYYHEGKKSDYAQATRLWKHMMSEQELYNIAPDYAQGIYDLLPKKDFEVQEVIKLSETACQWYKEKILQPAPGNRLVGFAPQTSPYQI
ncbi:hypothetical protein PG994_013845 [Apiospora phragmitis]|uniref:Catalase core domain-containing protein n=1 Tax=Apiospora phragmitis TaxID=2905665 RepID=A0ABR1T2M9_9PEZI